MKNEIAPNLTDIAIQCPHCGWFWPKTELRYTRYALLGRRIGDRKLRCVKCTGEEHVYFDDEIQKHVGADLNTTSPDTCGTKDEGNIK